MYGIKDILLTQERNDYHEHLSEGTFELDCSMGSNPYGSWPGLKAPADLFTGSELYPESEEPLKQAICDYYKDLVELTPKNILPTVGSIGAVMAINRMLLHKGKVIVGIAPQFSAVVDDFVTYEVDYRPVYLKKENNYKFDAEDILEAVKANPDAFVYIDNPNNPTGQVLSLKDQERICAAAKEVNSFVLLDEAYGDYMDPADSALNLVHKYDNLAVCRTFSKAQGMAGIRLGYIIANPVVIGAAAKVNTPYAMHCIADYMARQVITSGWAEECKKRVTENKPKVLAALNKIKYAETVETVPITMLYVEDPDINLEDVLEKAGIRAISCEGYEGLGVNSVRLNLHADIDKLVELIKKAEEFL